MKTYAHTNLHMYTNLQDKFLHNVNQLVNLTTTNYHFAKTKQTDQQIIMDQPQNTAK